jgi:hypothetical protein
VLRDQRAPRREAGRRLHLASGASAKGDHGSVDLIPGRFTMSRPVEDCEGACWGSQSRSGRSQRKSSRFTLQFRRPKHPGVSSGDSTQRKSGNRAELPIRFCRRRRLAVDYVELRADVKRGRIPEVQPLPLRRRSAHHPAPTASTAPMARNGRRVQDVPLHQCGRENHCR